MMDCAARAAAKWNTPGYIEPLSYETSTPPNGMPASATPPELFMVSSMSVTTCSRQTYAVCEHREHPAAGADIDLADSSGAAGGCSTRPSAATKVVIIRVQDLRSLPSAPTRSDEICGSAAGRLPLSLCEGLL